MKCGHVIIPLWRTDKFAVGDWVVWSEIDAIDHLELRERFGAGGFRVVKVHNEPYSPNEDALSVGYPRHAAMGHTQYVWVDQGGDEPAQYSGAFFRRAE
jgi:hypothetical protein